MVGPSSPWRADAIELCKKFPNVATRTLAKRLAAEFGITVDQARWCIRYVRGSIGREHRKYRLVAKKNGKSGTAPQLPPSAADHWEPHYIDGRSVAILSDIHVPYHSLTACMAAIDHCAKLKPDTVLLNGDIMDFYAVSRFTRDPRKRRVKDEIKSTKALLEVVRHMFPTAAVIYKKGNHEERWDHWLWNHAPEVCDMEQVQLENLLSLSNYGAVMIGDQRPIFCGKLPVFHGHELPKGLTNPVNMARGAYLRTCDTVLVGHGHRTSVHSEPNWKHDEVTTWSTGCLCDLTPEYARINKWNHGFAFVEVDRSGDFQVHNFRVSKDGKVRAS